jgi:two-component system, cell cycle sensor histidine kinase and response regulator CckA
MGDAVSSSRISEILLVEDADSDRVAAIGALHQAGILNSINVVGDGVEALAYLRREGKFSNALPPDVMLLDLDLPKEGARRLISQVRSDPILTSLTIVGVTNADADVVGPESTVGLVDAVLRRPIDLSRFAQALRAVGSHWLQLVALAPEAIRERYRRSEPPLSRALPNPISQRIRLLLIEDSAADVAIFRAALEGAAAAQFETFHVQRLADVEDVLRSRQVDLVMTDLDLPDSTGLATYRRVRTLAGGLPVIVLTGLHDDAIGVRAMQEGAQDYLVKGELDARALARAARYAIDKRVHQDELRHRQSLEAVGRVAAGVAHDFNNLLSIVHGNAELIESITELSQAKECAEEIQDAASRAVTLARQLLSLSRKQELNTKPIDLNRVVGDFSRMLRRVLGEDIRLELQLAAELPEISADAGMLEQVLLNLSINARDAMVGAGKVCIRTSSSTERTPAGGSPNSSFVSLVFADNGPGIPPDILSKIFEPFFTTKPETRGSGLGLSTVREIVKQHNGQIYVTSLAGEGAKFEILIPVAIGASNASRSSNRAVVASAGGELILVVDNEPKLRQLASRALQREGYRTLEASAYAEALAVWKEHTGSIDLLVTDILLQDGETGLVLAKRLALAKSSLPVIFTSGSPAEMIGKGEGLVQGVNFLQKPFSLARLVSLVRHGLRSQAQSR